MSTTPESVSVTPAIVEAALRDYLAHLDYDLHKGIECGEEDGADTYPQEAADLFGSLVIAAEPTHEGADPAHGGLTTHRGTREQCSGPDCGPVEEQPAARRVLTEAEYETTWKATRNALGARAGHIGTTGITDAVVAALATVGILTPSGEPNGDTCPAMFADLNGEWHQCAADPDHDPANGHDSGEWAWPHGETQARPEPDEDDAPTGEKYPCGICVFCDECGTEARGDYIVTDEMTSVQRLTVARADLSARLGWSCSEAGDFCPACTASGGEQQ